jgi:hypothetical protein
MAAAIRRKHMKKLNVYRTVVDMAEDLKQWPILTLLLYVGTPEKRAEVLEATFLRAIDHKDDEAARILYALLRKNFVDAVAVSATRERDGEESLTRDEAEAIVANANRFCTLKTMELYAKISGIRKLVDGEYCRVENWSNPKDPALLETKKAMLEQIASRWKDTSDDEEADKCFEFLFTAFQFTSHHKEDENFNGLMRAATPEWFSTNRLERSLLLLSKKSREHQAKYKVRDLANILGNAWVRNSDYAKKERTFRAVRPIAALWSDLFSEGRITAAFDFLGRTSAEIAQFHLALDELFASMKKRDVMQVPGNRQISYHSTKWATVRIEVEIDPSYYRSSRKDIGEDGHKWFELARDYTVKWREQYQQYKVDLELVVRMKHSETLIFERKQTIG